MDIQLVAIDRHLKHQDHKTCFGWNKEPNEDVRDHDILTRFPEFNYSYKAIDANEEDICNVCLWFNEPYHGKKQIVFEELSIPISKSPYCLSKILKGKINKKYNQEYGYIKTISKTDFKDMSNDVCFLDPPVKLLDINDFRQTIKAINFIERWMDHDNVDILSIYCGGT
jgi:hypothetical protein